MEESAGRMKILLMAALPQEYSPLKRLVPSFRFIAKVPFPTYAADLPDKSVVLLETGMGEARARRAFAEGAARFSPDLVIFAGFGGGLHPDLGVGSVCVVERSIQTASGTEFRFGFGGALSQHLHGNGISKVVAFTAARPESKARLSGLAGGELAVVDMETSAIADEATRAGAAFLCLRAVSDAVGDELGFDIADITDGEGTVVPGKVVRTILQKPATLRSFYLSWLRSRTAAKNLCREVAALLRIGAGSLGAMTRSISIERAD